MGRKFQGESVLLSPFVFSTKRLRRENLLDIGPRL